MDIQQQILQELALIRNRLDKLSGNQDDLFFMVRSMTDKSPIDVDRPAPEEIVRIPRHSLDPERFDPAISDLLAQPIGKGDAVRAEVFTTETASLDPDTVAVPVIQAKVGLLRSYGLMAGGSATVSMDDTVIEDREITGGLIIEAGRVVIKNCRFIGNGTTYHAVVTKNGGSVRIENCEFTKDYITTAFAGDNIDIVSCMFTGLTASGAELGSNVSMSKSIMCDFVGNGGHDGIRILRPVGAVSVTECEISVPRERGNGALVCSAQLAGVPDRAPIIISDCTFGGGEYTVALDDTGTGGSFGTLHFENNLFKRDALFQPVYPNGYVAARWNNNSYEDGERVGPSPTMS